MLKAIMSKMGEGTVDGVIVIGPQRLSRGDLEDCDRIINTLNALGKPKSTLYIIQISQFT